MYKMHASYELTIKIAQFFYLYINSLKMKINMSINCFIGSAPRIYLTQEFKTEKIMSFLKVVVRMRLHAVGRNLISDFPFRCD